MMKFIRQIRQNSEQTWSVSASYFRFYGAIQICFNLTLILTKKIDTLLLFLNPQYSIVASKMLKTKQVPTPLRRLVGGESAVEGDRITPL